MKQELIKINLMGLIEKNDFSKKHRKEIIRILKEYGFKQDKSLDGFVEIDNENNLIHNNLIMEIITVTMELNEYYLKRMISKEMLSSGETINYQK